MPDALSALSSSLAALVAATAPRLVALRGGDGTVASGIVWADGLVVSAHEALGEEEELAVHFADGTTRRAELAGRDPGTDVALLRVETDAVGALAAAPVPQVGSLAVVGGRGDFGPTALLAIVSEVGPAWRSLGGGAIDARIGLGLRMPRAMEGGAVLSAEGGLLGLAASGPRRLGLVVPYQTVARAVDALASRGYVPRGYLGATLHPAGRGSGAVVVGIEADGPAERAGFLVGDIITTWDNQPVAQVTDVSHRLGSETVGRRITAGVLRGGSPIELDVTVGERPRR